MTKEMSHMLSSLQVSYCRETKLSVVSIQSRFVTNSSSEIAQEFWPPQVKFTREQEQKTFGVYILPSLSQVLETINLHLDKINLYRNDR